MDVSKQINLTTRLTNLSSLQTEALQPVALEKLALIPAQTYEARAVVKASAEILQTLSANLNAATTTAKPDPAATSEQSDSLWLLRVQGKILLAELPAEAGKSLHPGDRLWIQLRSDGSLAFRPAPSAPTALNPVPTGELAPLLELAKTRIEQHLARTLHQQQPVSSVLTQLSPQNQPHAKPETQALLQQVIDVLRARVPSRDLFQILNTPIAPARAKELPNLPDTLSTQIARTLQHYLDKQGLTFERSLFGSMTERGSPPSAATTPTSSTQTPETSAPSTSSPATPAAQEAKSFGPLKTLLQRFSADSATASSSSPSSSPAPVSAPATPAPPMPPGEMARQFQFNTAQALATARHPTDTTTTSVPSAGSTMPVNPPTLPGNLMQPSIHEDTDLKGALLGLIKTLSQGLKSDESLTNKPAPTSATQDNLQLLTNPLAFPRPMLPPAMLKANAMLAEEELSTGQILRLLASLLHRIQFNQLNSLHQTASNSSDNVSTQSWMFDLPVINNSTQQFDFFQLRLDREKHHAPKGESEEKTKIQWKISLSFNFDGLGQINIHLRLLPPTATSVIWATQTNTLQLLKKHAEHLRERLSLLGLTLHEIQYQEGAPATESRPIQASIVDTRA